MNLNNKLMIDKSIDTPDHFIEKHYNANYCWNGHNNIIF